MTTATAVDRSAPSSQEHAQGHAPKRAKYALLLGGLTAFGPLSIDMYLPALPTMTGDLGTTDAMLQLTLTAFVIGLAIGQLVAGPLSDKLGRRRPLLAGVAIYVTASVVAAMSPSVEVLIGARFVQALGAAAGIVIARATVRDLFEGKDITRFFSMLMLVTGAAPILAPMIGGQILGLTTWRGIFWTLTVFGAFLLVVIGLILPEPLPHHRRSGAGLGSVLRTYAGLLRERSFLGYALTAGLLFAAMFSYISGSSFVLQGVYGLSAQQYSIVFGAGAIGIVVMSQVNGRLVGRFAERSLLRTGVTGATLGSLCMVAAAVFGWSLPALLIPLVFVVSCVGLVMPNCMSLSLANHPDIAGSASALLGMMQFAVAGISAPLVSLGGEGTAIPMTVTMASFATLALVAFATLTRVRLTADAARA